MSTDTDPKAAHEDQVPIRLPSGEQAWVSADAFNLISEKEFRDSERLRRLRAQRNLAAAVAVAALTVFAAGVVALSTRRAPPAPAGTGTVATSSTAAVQTAEASPANDPDVEQAVRAWARAWSARDAEAVLACYSPAYLVPDGMRQATWEQLRRERIESPELLSIAVEDLVAERTGPETAVARFLQVYDTPGYRAWVMKTLELAFESGRWLIVDEVTSLAEIGTGAFQGEPVDPAPDVTNP